MCGIRIKRACLGILQQQAFGINMFIGVSEIFATQRGDNNNLMAEIFSKRKV